MFTLKIAKKNISDLWELAQCCTISPENISTSLQLCFPLDGTVSAKLFNHDNRRLENMWKVSIILVLSSLSNYQKKFNTKVCSTLRFPIPRYSPKI